jgi:NADH-quinone oxidoreductase subunit M
LFGAFFLSFIPSGYRKYIQIFSLVWSLLIFNCVIALFCLFDPTNTQFQLCSSLTVNSSANFAITFGVDGLSLLLVLLTAFLIPICVLLS